MEEKDIVAQNLTAFRKAARLTQQELADRLNYTDKAVSKWERAEALPDILVLKKLADMYGITVDDLLTEHEKPAEAKTPEIKKHKLANHWLITLLSAGLVWFVATIIVGITLIVAPEIPMAKYAYLSALPVCFIVVTVFSALWSKLYVTALCVSGIVWSSCLCFHMFLTSPNAWAIYLIGAVFQVLVVLWYLLLYFKKKYKK